jgi:hypothetical protein
VLIPGPDFMGVIAVRSCRLHIQIDIDAGLFPWFGFGPTASGLCPDLGFCFEWA